MSPIRIERAFQRWLQASPRSRLERWLEDVWYPGPEASFSAHATSWALWPLSGLTWAWAHRPLRGTSALEAPVLVVGNLVAGGTGKTTLATWLASRASDLGLEPGVIMRGYRARHGPAPRLVSVDDDYQEVGDEALMVRMETGVPVAVHPKRTLAAKHLIERCGCNLVIADDGLQHRALPRDAELLMVDGGRGFGNRRLLPAGPLREPLNRLNRADLIIATDQPVPGIQVDGVMRTQLAGLVTLDGRPAAWPAEPVAAIAGIANPDRFFAALWERVAVAECHAYADHHPYRGDETPLQRDVTVITTAKDAVRLRAIAGCLRAKVLVTQQRVSLDAPLEDRLDSLLSGLSACARRAARGDRQ